MVYGFSLKAVFLRGIYMTYRQLFEQLKKLNNEQLNQDVTVYDKRQDEYFAASEFVIASEVDDILDAGHYVMKFDS